MSQSNLSTAVQEVATDTIVDIDFKVKTEKSPDLRKDHPKSHALYYKIVQETIFIEMR